MALKLADAYVQIIPVVKGIKAQLEKPLEEETEKSGKESGNRAGNAIVGKIIKIIAAAKIGETLVKGISASVNEGAALEQSIGGIETLFKESSSAVMRNAQNAYKTAGLSANAYMESVTEFSASLLQGLGGDTEKAAKIADMALTDMSDNANKMGTDMDSIQVAYQGFAKQNYTMLDNLKLGYGGTKEEMQRLLKDAEKVSGVQYDMSNLSDIYSAIHVIQDELDITGTTSKEAATTISGSLASMKASFSNVLGYLAIGEDIKPYLTDLVTTTSTFLFGNLLPAVGNVLSGMPTIVSAAINVALPELCSNAKSVISTIMSVITTEGPGFIATGKEILSKLSSGLQENIPVLLAKVLPMLASFSQTIRENIGTIVDAGLNLLVSMVKGLAAGIPTLVQYVPTIVTNIAGVINDNMPKILSTGVKLIGILVKGLIDAIPTIISNMPKIINSIVNAITAFNWLNLGAGIVTGLEKGISSMFGSIGESSTHLLENVIKAFREFDFAQLGSNIVQGIIKGMKGAASALKDYMTSLASSALSTVKSALGIHSPSRVFEEEVGQMIPLGMAQGIGKYAKAVSDEMKQLSGEMIADANVNMESITVPKAAMELPGDTSELKSIIMDALAASNLSVYVNGREVGRLVRGVI